MTGLGRLRNPAERELRPCQDWSQQSGLLRCTAPEAVLRLSSLDMYKKAQLGELVQRTVCLGGVGQHVIGWWWEYHFESMLCWVEFVGGVCGIGQ